jgi:beta-alanine degradation protein BauB
MGRIVDPCRKPRSDSDLVGKAKTALALPTEEDWMRARLLLAIASSCILASVVLAQVAGGDKPKPYAGQAAERPIVMPAGELKWTDLDPAGAPGVKVAALWGDHTKGAFGAFFKLPAGFAVPLHTHTHDMHVVFVSGTYIQAPDGQPPFRLGAGSYLMQPGRDYRHTTSCDSTAECVFFVESKGAFDLKVVGADKAK